MSRVKTEENIIYYDVTLTSEGKTFPLRFAIDFTFCNEEQSREIAAREIRTRALDKCRINSQDKEVRINAKREKLGEYLDEMELSKSVRVDASDFATIRASKPSVKIHDLTVEQLRVMLSTEQLLALQTSTSEALKETTQLTKKAL